ncbi:MAG: hypothetical protein MJZ65_05005 [Paludibacteraceae bacterium]|nr:hypothetical protein [Paludibacteraceae bacterium]
MKTINYSILCALLCTSVLVGCKQNDEPTEPSKPEPTPEPTTILGTWSLQTHNGQSVYTNDRTIITYAEGGNKWFSLAKYIPDFGMTWRNKAYATYKCENDSMEEVFDGTTYFGNIAMPNNDLLSVHMTKSISKKGTESVVDDTYDYKRVSNALHYEDIIIGVWEGVEMTGPETYGDANHRFEYKTMDASGYLHFVYMSKNDQGEWVPDPTNTNNIYNVHGDWLATTWIQNGENHYEWWDITELNDTIMKWGAVREDATTHQSFTTTFKLRRVTE